MKSKYLLLITLICMTLALSGCNDDTTAKTDIKEEVVEASKEEVKIGQKYAEISDEDVELAIEEGKKGMEYYYQKYFGDGRSLEYIEGQEGLVKEIHLYTPYASMVLETANKKSRYEDVKSEDVLNVAKEIENKVYVMTSVAIPQISSHSSMHGVIKQGNVVIQPEFVDGLDSTPSLEGDLTSETPYEAFLNFLFDMTKIDTNKEAEFILIYSPTTEIRYNIDFNKYK